MASSVSARNAIIKSFFFFYRACSKINERRAEYIGQNTAAFRARAGLVEEKVTDAA